MKSLCCLLMCLSAVYGCAGPNPNPGERTADIATLKGDFNKAFGIVKLAAEKGEPWAQLRLGVFYENGWGVDQNPRRAIEWYERALSQKSQGAWAEGQIAGAVGRAGYFNQNSDARIAEFNLAQLLHKGSPAHGVERDLARAYAHLANVIDESQGKDIFFCCEFATPRYFTQHQFQDLHNQLTSEMTTDQIRQAQELIVQFRQNKAPSVQ